jgi:hypothetical protein
MRSLAVLLAAAIIVPAPALAQVGGLRPKKIVERVTGKTDTTKAAAPAGKPRCDPSKLVITADVVDRYVKSFSARDAELTRMSREPGETGRYWSAVLQRREIERRRDEYNLNRGPDYDKMKAIQARMMRGDTTAITAQLRLSQELEPSRVVVPSISWETQQQYDARVDQAQLTAGGFSECDWAGIGEKIPRITGALSSGDDAQARDFGTAAEVAAVRARLPDLKRVLGFNTRDSAQERREADQRAMKTQKELQDSADAQMDPVQLCIKNAQAAFAKEHEAEIDRAQKAGDQAALTRISMAMAQASQKCVSQ